MKNTAVLYAAIVLGVIGLALGVYYLTTGVHPFRAFVGLGVGALLLIGGVVGMFMGRSKAVSR